MAGGVATEVTERTAELAPTGGGSLSLITSFGRDALGALYIVARGGALFRVVPDGVESQCGAVEPAVPALPGWARGAPAVGLVITAAALLPAWVGRWRAVGSDRSMG